MRVCYFGIYDREHARNRVQLLGLKRSGVDVREVNTRQKGIGKYLRLWWQALAAEPYDVLFLAFPGQGAAIFARLFLAQKPILFDLFTSLYDTNVFDRRLVPPDHPKARWWYLLDWLSVRLADRILIDTKTHRDYLARLLRVPKEKFTIVPVGNDDTVFSPAEPPADNPFTVHFHGAFIPLQGTETIIRAAELLERESVYFNLIGRGQERWKIEQYSFERGLGNVRFFEPVPFSELKDWMTKAHVALGIFGTTPKALRVIPNKVYEALAMGKAIITSDTPAARELLHDRENVLFVRPGDPEDLARKILQLKEDSALRRRLEEGAHRLFQEKLTPTHLGAEMKEILGTMTMMK